MMFIHFTFLRGVYDISVDIMLNNAAYALSYSCTKFDNIVLCLSILHQCKHYDDYLARNNAT